MSDRCSKCHRKKHAAGRATNPDLCHRTGSPECLVGERAYSRALRDVSVHVTALVADVAYDGEEKTIDSMGIATVANAMRFLASLGRIQVVEDHGPQVVGRWST